MSPSRHSVRPCAARSPRPQHGLTLIEMLVAVVLSLAILGATTAVTQMVVRRYQQIGRLDDAHQRLDRFKARLALESSEIAGLQTASQYEWVFTSVWRAPGEPWLPRDTRLACEQEQGSGHWYLVLGHRNPEPVANRAAVAAAPPAPTTEWGRVGPWVLCEFEVGSVQALKDAPDPKPEVLVWERPASLATAAPIRRFRVLLTDPQGRLLPWVFHVR